MLVSLESDPELVPKVEHPLADRSRRNPRRPPSRVRSESFRPRAESHCAPRASHNPLVAARGHETDGARRRARIDRGTAPTRIAPRNAAEKSLRWFRSTASQMPGNPRDAGQAPEPHALPGTQLLNGRPSFAPSALCRGSRVSGSIGMVAVGCCVGDRAACASVSARVRIPRRSSGHTYWTCSSIPRK